MQGRLEEFRKLEAEIVVVSFVEPARLRQYLQVKPWPFTVLADPGRATYRTFGLGSATWFQLLNPRVIAKYIALIVRGRRPQLAKEDVHQLGGDFVLDRTGRVVFEYRSHDPTDRPDVSVLLDVVRKIA